MRHTCEWQVNNIECGAPAVDHLQITGGFRMYVCADHWDEAQPIIKKEKEKK